MPGAVLVVHNMQLKNRHEFLYVMVLGEMHLKYSFNVL
jgi:hypothetical protein